MHRARAQVLDNDVAICHPFRNPEMTNVYVTGSLGPGPPAFHERDAIEVVLVYNNGADRIALLRHKILEVHGLSRGVGEANELWLNAGLCHDLLLGGAG